MWYVETRSFDGRAVAAVYADCPPDQRADGRKQNFLVKVEVHKKHENLSLDELKKIYGSHVIGGLS